MGASDGLRIGDAERETAVHLLGEQYAVGRLTKEEFDERSDAAWSARTGSDLAPLFADLPVVAPGQPAPVVRRDRPPAYSRRANRHLYWRRSFPVPWLPIVLVLLVLTLLTHLPLLLLALGLWFFLGRWHWYGGGRYSRRRS